MKTSLLLGLLLAATTMGARAQQTPAPAATTDAWGVEAKPAAAPADAVAAPADAALAPAATTGPDSAAVTAAPSGIEAALGAETAATSTSKEVKPITVQPKLNPNSAGTYDKSVVKKQNKHTTKTIAKRRRATAKYADIRRADRLDDMRRMERGKVTTATK